MIDLNKELKEMAEHYGLTEKEVATWWRSGIRQLWGNSPFKRKYEAENSELITNTNPRSRKRYPKVKRFTCTDCGNKYGAGEMDLDHKKGMNTMKDLSYAESFMKSILLAKREDLQFLCADKKKIVNKKKYVYSSGCHGIKTLIDLNPNMSRSEAVARKEFTRIKKYDGVDKGLKERGVKTLPKFIKDQESLLLDLLLKEYKNK